MATPDVQSEPARRRETESFIVSRASVIAAEVALSAARFPRQVSSRSGIGLRQAGRWIAGRKAQRFRLAGAGGSQAILGAFAMLLKSFVTEAGIRPIPSGRRDIPLIGLPCVR